MAYSLGFGCFFFYTASPKSVLVVELPLYALKFDQFQEIVEQ